MKMYLRIHVGVNPLDDLTVQELRKELTARGVHVGKKLKPELTLQFNELRQGLNDVPALLQSTPQAQLKDLNLERYEISPIEPLHDIKGHIGNIIDEAIAVSSGEVLKRLTTIKTAVLSKNTLRCSDYRKAVIMMYMALEEVEPTSLLTEIFQTAVEINEILYAKAEKRNRKQILRLHNVTFIHCMLCREVFSNPVQVTRTRMFGRYYHAITYHAPLVHNNS